MKMFYFTFTLAGVSVSIGPVWLLVLFAVAFMLLTIIVEWAIRKLIVFLFTSRAELIKRIFTIFKVIEKHLAIEIGDSYERIKKKINIPNSYSYEFWLKFKGFMKELFGTSNEIFSQIPSDAWISKKDDDTKNTAKLEDLTNESFSTMKTESGEMVENANLISTETDEKKLHIQEDDATEDEYDIILAKLDTLAEIRKSQLASEKKKKINEQHDTILAKLVALMEEKEINKNLMSKEEEIIPDKNQSGDLVIKKASEIIDISQGQRIRKAEDTIEKIQQATSSAMRSIEKKTISLGDGFFRYYLHFRFFRQRRKV
jgi:hypothetical protein